MFQKIVQNSAFFYFVICVCYTANCQELREKVISEWKKLDRETRVTNFEKQVLNNGKALPTTRFAVQDDLQKIERGSSVYLSSSFASYILAKNAVGGWTIENLSDSEELFDEEMNRNLAMSIGDVCLLNAIANDNYEFDDWRTEGDRIVFKVRDLKEIELQQSKTQHQPSAFATITVTVDPGNLCRIVSTEENAEWKQLTAVIRQEYQYLEDRYVPSAVNRTSNVSNGKTLKLERSFAQISHDRLPAAEFSLEHYGLKEIYSKPWQWQRWLMIVAIPVGVFVGFRCWKYVRSGN